MAWTGWYEFGGNERRRLLAWNSKPAFTLAVVARLWPEVTAQPTTASSVNGARPTTLLALVGRLIAATCPAVERWLRTSARNMRFKAEGSALSASATWLDGHSETSSAIFTPARTAASGTSTVSTFTSTWPVAAPSVASALSVAKVERGTWTTTMSPERRGASCVVRAIADWVCSMMTRARSERLRSTSISGSN